MFVFSSSPVANATIEVRGTAAVGIVPSLSLEMPSPASSSSLVSPQEGKGLLIIQSQARVNNYK